MKINVDRTTNSEGDLVFTITVKEPHLCPFTEQEKTAMESIENFTRDIATKLDPNGIYFQDVLNANHLVKEKTFLRVLQNLKFAIKNELEPKFHPMCQEIYNWIYDNQKGYIKSWLADFDPQRTTYYFDNDRKIEPNNINSPFTYPEDKDSDDEEGEDDEEEDEDED